MENYVYCNVDYLNLILFMQYQKNCLIKFAFLLFFGDFVSP